MMASAPARRFVYALTALLAGSNLAKSYGPLPATERHLKPSACCCLSSVGKVIKATGFVMMAWPVIGARAGSRLVLSKRAVADPADDRYLPAVMSARNFYDGTGLRFCSGLGIINATATPLSAADRPFDSCFAEELKYPPD